GRAGPGRRGPRTGTSGQVPADGASTAPLRSGRFLHRKVASTGERHRNGGRHAAARGCPAPRLGPAQASARIRSDSRPVGSWHPGCTNGTALARRAAHSGEDVRTIKTLTIAPALATIATGARATTFVAMTERALARAADAIVVGTVRYIETVAAPDGTINTLVTVEVEQEAKGHVGRVVVLKQPGGSVGGRRLWLAGSPDFTVNDRELLFLSAYRDGTAR